MAVLQRLAQDRELVLHDGTHLMGAARYDACMQTNHLTPADMTAQGLRRIHPAFRMVAVGEPTRADGTLGPGVFYTLQGGGCVCNCVSPKVKG